MSEWPDFAVPETWSLTPIEELAETLRAGGTPSRKNKAYFGGDIPFAIIEDITGCGTYLDSTKQAITREGLEASSAWIVPKRSVLLSMYATIGATAINTIPVATNQAILAIVPKETCHPEFLCYCLQAHKRHLAQLNVESTQKNVNKGIVSSFRLPLPPLQEQKSIANILLAVQRAIEAQERIIQVTTELKQALMQKLFSEGLRGEPQKESEIGLVPESWEVVECGDVCETISVGIVVQPSSYYVKEGVPAFRSQNVRADRIQAEPLVYISKEANDGPVKKSRLSAGDVLIVRTGYPGTSCVVPPEFEGSNCIDLIFARPDKSRLSSHYLSRFFNSDLAKRQVQAGKTGLAQQHYNVAAVKSTKIPLPSLRQQDEIASYLELVDSKIDIAVSRSSILQELFGTLLHELMSAKKTISKMKHLTGGPSHD